MNDALMDVNLPTAKDIAQGADYLRAAQLARQWLETVGMLDPKRVTHHRAFIVGYLAALRDRT